MSHKHYDPLVELRNLSDKTKGYLRNLFAGWVNQGIHFLSISIHASEFLFDSDIDLINDEQEKIIEMMRIGHTNSLNHWQLIADYTHRFFGIKDEECESVYLINSVKHITSDMDVDIKTKFPDNHLLVELENLSDEAKNYLEYLFIFCVHDGRSFLNMYISASEFLFDSDINLTGDEQEELIEIMRSIHARSLNHWHLLSDYMRYLFGIKDEEWEAVYLTNLVKHITSEINVDIKIKFPDNLPPIKGTHRSLQKAVHYLSDPYSSPYQDDDITDCPIVIKAEQDGSFVLFQINTGIKLHSNDVKQPRRLSRLYGIGDRLSVADLIIQQYGSQVMTYSVDEGTAFQFALPVWDS